MCGRPEEEVWQVCGRTSKVIGSLFNLYLYLYEYTADPNYGDIAAVNIKGARLTLTPGHFISPPTTGPVYGTMGLELAA